MRKNLKYLIISLFALLVFSCGIVLISHDFSVNNNDTQEEEEIEESDATGCYMGININIKNKGYYGNTVTVMLKDTTTGGSYYSRELYANGNTTDNSSGSQTVSLTESFSRTADKTMTFGTYNQTKWVSEKHFAYTLTFAFSTVGYCNYILTSTNGCDDGDVNRNDFYYTSRGVSYSFQKTSSGYTNGLTGSLVPKENYEYTLICQEFTEITMDPNGGSGDTQTVYGKYDGQTYLYNSYSYNSSIATITQPTRTGYVFGGWETSGGTLVIGTSGNLVSGATNMVDNYSFWIYNGTRLSLRARWTPITYNITFDANKPASMTSNITQTLNGKAYTSTPTTMSNFVEFDSIVSKTAKASATGWTFNGYSTSDSGGQTIFDGNGNIVKNVSGYTDSNGEWKKAANTSLYAQWTANEHTVNFDLKNGTTSNTVSGITYTFDSNSGTIKLNGSLNASINAFVTYFPSSMSKEDVYNISITKTAGSYSGGGVFACDLRAGNDNDLPYRQTEGLRTNVDIGFGGGSANLKYLSARTESIDRIGIWLWYNLNSPVTFNNAEYKIVIKKNSATTSFSKVLLNKQSNLQYNQVIQIDNPTRTGYTFAGWTFNGNTSTAKHGMTNSTTSSWSNTSTKVTSTYFKNLTPTNLATVTLTANWTANKYKTQFVYGNGSNNLESDRTYDEAFSVSAPTRDGYKFNGWNITAMDSTTHVIGTDTSTATSINNCKATSFKNLRATSGTVIFTAQWTPNKMTIRYYLNGGTSKLLTEDSGNPLTNGTPAATQNWNYNSSSEYGLIDPSTNRIKKDGYLPHNNYWNTKANGTGANVSYRGSAQAGTGYTLMSTAVEFATAAGILDSFKAGDVTLDLYVIWIAQTYKVTLDRQGGSGGTDYVYQKYDNGYYTDLAATNKMNSDWGSVVNDSSYINHIQVPTKNGYVFGGYYASTAYNESEQYFDSYGRLRPVEYAPVNHFKDNNGKLYAKWVETWLAKSDSANQSKYATKPSGTGKQNDPYLIASAANFAWFAYQVNYVSGQNQIHAKQTANIDLNARYWYPIGTATNKFAGVYNGQNYQISNCKTYMQTNDGITGLFGYVSAGTITNVYMSGANIKGTYGVGGIVGEITGNAIITKNIVKGSISDGINASAITAYVGGIVGNVTAGSPSINTNIFEGTLTKQASTNTNSRVGLICGSYTGKITDCLGISSQTGLILNPAGSRQDCMSILNGAVSKSSQGSVQDSFTNWAPVNNMKTPMLPKALFWIV